MVERAALFVRLPADVMASIDELVRTTGRTKQAVVTGFVEAAVVKSVSKPEVDPAGSDTAILDLDEVAALLRVRPEQVVERVKGGDLPGRCFGDDWRFSREAVLRWLDGADKSGTRKPGFTR
jgi:excisionase family DNA binding protein